MNIVQAFEDGDVFGGFFKDPASWGSWRVFFKAVYGLPMTAAEFELFKRSTGLSAAPVGRFKEAYVVAGRRSGKSTMAALLAVYEALFGGWAGRLSRGEKPVIVVVSVDKAQAGIVKGYCEAFLRLNAGLRSQIKRVTAEQIELKNGLTLLVKTCSWRSIRGYTMVAAVLEETSFWRYEAESANRDVEVLRAIRPALATTGGPLISISSPYARSGLMYEAWKEHWGKAGEKLVWQAATRVMNPTLPAEIIEQALVEDREAALSEWEAEWRADISSYIERELVDSLLIPGRYVLAPVAGMQYKGFADPSGGSGQDSFAVAVAHKGEAGQVVLDFITEKRPPFSPETIVGEFAEVLRGYGISRISGDLYAGSWPAEAFAKHGITYEAAKKPASELYLELLPVLSSGRVELLDDQRLIGQLAGLERRTRAGGRDLVSHFRGRHDDLANVLAGVASLVGARPLGPAKGKFYHSGQLRRGSLSQPSTEPRLIPPGAPPGSPAVPGPPKKRHVFFTRSRDERLSSEWVRDLVAGAHADEERCQAEEEKIRAEEAKRKK
jgi:hypothetical protein